MRTDLKELVDVDLNQAPYGYAPMGDDREDMEGFRFWKTGALLLSRVPRRKASLIPWARWPVRLLEGPASRQALPHLGALRRRPQALPPGQLSLCPHLASRLLPAHDCRPSQIAAGDRLRGAYQGFSQDPNSLANLDQDLPNVMQEQIPIHTLDPSWLWCATWCSAESLAVAKT